MRKRMSRMKKEMAVAVAAAMCISLVGCGGGSSKKVVADKKEAVETTVAETTETETTAEKLTGVNDSEMPISWQELPGREFPAPRRSWWRPLMRKMPIWQF